MCGGYFFLCFGLAFNPKPVSCYYPFGYKIIVRRDGSSTGSVYCC